MIFPRLNRFNARTYWTFVYRIILLYIMPDGWAALLSFAVDSLGVFLMQCLKEIRGSNKIDSADRRF